MCMCILYICVRIRIHIVTNVSVYTILYICEWTGYTYTFVTIWIMCTHTRSFMYGPGIFDWSHVDSLVSVCTFVPCICVRLYHVYVVVLHSFTTIIHMSRIYNIYACTWFTVYICYYIHMYICIYTHIYINIWLCTGGLVIFQFVGIFYVSLFYMHTHVYKFEGRRTY